MSVWEVYERRMEVRGQTKRDAVKKREIRAMENKLPDNLSYQSIILYDQSHGYNITSEEMATAAIQQSVAIINSDNLNEKYVYSLPGEDIENGALISWMDNYWLVTERDANTTIYTRAKMVQCNYLLKWVADCGIVYQQWCIVEDGTKYLTGDYEDKDFVVTRGDSRIAVTIACNDVTTKLGRNNRFLIDAPGSPVMLAYSLTKPFKLGGTFNGKGVFKFVLQETTTTENDEPELGIADYYKYFPTKAKTNYGNGIGIDINKISEDTGKRVWL